MAAKNERFYLVFSKTWKFNVYSVVRNMFILILLNIACVDCLHLQGTWKSGDFYKFLAKFGFQKTSEHDKLNTQGYIYGNISTSENYTSVMTLVVVDSEYFLQFYGNRSAQPRTNACPAMFGKIKRIAWDYTCNPTGREDFLRRVPCPLGKRCADEDSPERVVPGYQFTYAVQDINQPR